ncbi:DUF5684 domain-containing protein [Microbacterium sp. ASV49]|uniref:DUF5684 domain-containing protein n=1 Tax=Microbacterium candidum TaxID=3041922 RepID=A0ABT7MXG5_9MICO|nr:DUF5684 domain-containing protein [Microbacterium sp. ASV49]MDL9979146.1 DUF5684 domain-containing protein [Microbacterium sp. ASV49]
MNDSAYTAALTVDLVVGVAAYVWMGLALSTVFRKAREKGWKAWVPFLNGFTLLELGGYSGWFILLALIPVIGWIALLVVSIMAYYRINVSFGFGAGMTVLAVLLTLVWFSVLAWGPARWLGGPGRGSMRTANADLDARIGGTDAGAPALSFSPAPPAPAAPVPAAPASVAPASAVPSPAAAPVSAFSPSAPSDAAFTPPAESSTSEPPTEQPAMPFAPPAPAFAPRAASAPESSHDADLDEDSDDAQIVGTTSSAAAPGPRRAPISSVPTAPIPTRSSSPWAQPADPADLTDTSGEISAVVGAPALGSPMSARSSVSAQRSEPEVPDDGFSDETIIAPRRRPRWVLTPPLGAPIHLTSDVVIVGRRPAEDPRFPNAQLVPIADETRTMSKTHARLERRDDVWTITDLASTNGVAVLAADGGETELAEGGSGPIGAGFLLGDAELRLTRVDA